MLNKARQATAGYELKSTVHAINDDNGKFYRADHIIECFSYESKKALLGFIRINRLSFG